MAEEPQGRKSPPDEVWARVREEYLAGWSAPDCCRRHGVGLTALRERAAREGWRRADQAWTPPDRLDPWDEGVELDLRVGGDLDKVGLEELGYVAHRRMMRAVMRGDAVEALRWRRVELTMAEVEAELERDVERLEAIRWRLEDDAEEDEPHPDASDAPHASDGVLASADLSPPRPQEGEVAARSSRADGGGDRVSTGEPATTLTLAVASPPPSRREAASRHLPIAARQGGDGMT